MAGFNLIDRARFCLIADTVEEDFKLAKGQVGLDQYEVTKYRGWYHHMTMSLLALCFLKVIQSEWGKKRGISISPRGASAA
jgi:SRSO17 transposase